LEGKIDKKVFRTRHKPNLMEAEDHLAFDDDLSGALTNNTLKSSPYYHYHDSLP